MFKELETNHSGVKTSEGIVLIDALNHAKEAEEVIVPGGENGECAGLWGGQYVFNTL